MCRLYQDCCWDFKLECREEWNTYQRHFSQRLATARAGCVLGKYVIVGDSRVAEDSNSTEFDHRKSIVTLREHPTVHFVNVDVYRLFFGDKNLTKHMVLWEKKIEGESNFLGEIETFFSTGVLTDEMQTSLMDVPPANIVPRKCLPAVSLRCSKGSRCAYRKKIYVTDINLTCRSVFSTLSLFSTTPSTSTQESSTEWPGYHNTTALYQDDQECTIQTYVMMVIRIDGGTGHGGTGHGLFLTMSFSPSDGVVIKAFDTKSDMWSAVEYRPVNEEPGPPQKLVVFCKKGFLYDGQDCVKPSMLNVYFIDFDVKGNQKRLYHYAKNVTSAMEKTFSEYLLSFRGDVRFGVSGLVQTLPLPGALTGSANVVHASWLIENYQLEYDETVLPLTERVTSHILNCKIVYAKIDTLLLCLTSQHSIRGNNVTLQACDWLSGFTGRPIKHLKLDGLVIPTDILLQMEPLAKKNSMTAKSD